MRIQDQIKDMHVIDGVYLMRSSVLERAEMFDMWNERMVAALRAENERLRHELKQALDAAADAKWNLIP